MAYFERLGESTFLATEHVGGAWNTAEQHIAPALGLLAHAVEADRDVRREDGLALTRLSYDILGTVPVAEPSRWPSGCCGPGAPSSSSRPACATPAGPR